MLMSDVCKEVWSCLSVHLIEGMLERTVRGKIEGRSRSSMKIDLPLLLQGRWP